MKRETALKNADVLHQRLHALTGIIATPEGHREAFRIKRAWVIGSTARGDANPSEVLILYEGFDCGRRQWANRQAWKDSHQENGRIRVVPRDKYRLKAHGWVTTKSSYIVALTALAHKLQKIRFVELGFEGELRSPRIMIYPRLDLYE